ncbi:uncharacterized protein LOC126828804 [Patella vulgata]|uniref:uncharacterized protein LOC126828804 n=1 Tax=Patella vulgata TaxID=6465 RepID=UPI0024A7E0B3|nr:uncharacterized protein LOC126828804 [Patella vulgata]
MAIMSQSLEKLSEAMGKMAEGRSSRSRSRSSFRIPKRRSFSISPNKKRRSILSPSISPKRRRVSHSISNSDSDSQSSGSFTCSKDARFKQDRSRHRPIGGPSQTDVTDDIEDLLHTSKQTKPLDTGASTSNDNVLQDINQSFEEPEQTGPEVTDKLAEIINKRFQNRLTDDILKKTFSKYLRPRNCSGLSIPNVNNEIWKQLSNNIKRQDLRLSYIQKAISKAASAITVCADEILDDKINDKSVVARKLIDSVALLGHASYDLSLKRRELIKPGLSPEFGGLCSTNVPVTPEYLFSDDLHLKDIRETCRLSSRVSSSYTPRRDDRPSSSFRPSSSYRPYTNTSTSHFLDKKGRGNYPRQNYPRQRSTGKSNQQTKQKIYKNRAKQ